MSATRVSNAHMMMIEVHLEPDKAFLCVTFADDFVAKVPINELGLSASEVMGAQLGLPNPFELEIFLKNAKEPRIYPWTLPRSFGDTDYSSKVASIQKNQRVLFAKKLRLLRAKKGFSQEGLARVSGVSRMTISRIENGRQYEPSVQTLRKISRALGCQIADLFSSFQAVLS